MTIEVAAEIVEFLGKYNEHFSRTLSFLREKQVKVLADDLDWLNSSLAEEQKLVMTGNSIEAKRIETLKKLGYDEATTSSLLLEDCPESLKGRMKLEFSGIEKHIDSIKQLNAEILETVEKKLSSAETYLKQKGVMPADVYGAEGKKARFNNPDDDVIGTM